MQTRQLLTLVLLAPAWSCGSVVNLTSVDASMSVVVPAQPNAAANGAEVVPILIRLASHDGAPLVGLQVSLSSQHCVVTQPTSPTDATGTARGSLRCTAPGLQDVGVSIGFNDATALLTVTGAVNFYPAANSSGAVLAGASLMAQAVAYNAANTVDLDYSGTVTFGSTDPLATLPAAQTLGAADHGYRALPNSLILRTRGRQTVTCTDATSGAILSTQTLDVVAAPPKTLQLSLPTSTVVAGDSATVTVSAIDAYGNVDPSYVGMVSFASSDALARVPGAYTFIASDQGSKTFVGAFAPRTAGQQLLLAQGGGLTGTEHLTVLGGEAVGLQLAVNANVVAGVPQDLTVAAVDAYGNASSSYTGTVQWTCTDPNATLPATTTFTATDLGTHLAPQSLILRTAGLNSLLVADANDAALQIATADIETSAAAPQHLVLRVVATATAGSSLNPIVVAEDAFGNASPAYVGTVAFSSTDGRAVVPANYTFQVADAGAHAFVQSLRPFTAGSAVTSVQDLGGLQGDSATTVVVPANASVLQVSGASSVAAGESLDLTLTALDPYGNVATSFADTVQLTNTDPRGSCVPTVSLQQGTAFVSAGASFTGSGAWQVSAADPNDATLSREPLPVQVNPGPLVALSLVLPTVLRGAGHTASVGQLLTPTVSALDAYQNPVAGYSGTVHFTSTDPNAVLPPDRTFGASDGGVVAFTNGLSFLSTGSAMAVTVNDAASALSASVSGVQVVHRCGYLDGVGVVPATGGYTQNGTSALDPNGHPYIIDRTELGAVALQSWQLYATQWTGSAWTTNETPPRPATSLIDDGNSTGDVARPFTAYGASGPAVAYEGHSPAVSGIFYAQRVDGVWAGLAGSQQAPIGAGGVFPNLVLDSNTNPWVFWLDSKNALHLRSWNGAAWAVVGGNELLPMPPITTNAARANYAVAIDSADNVYVAWGGPNNIFLIEWSAGAWGQLGNSATGGGISQSAHVATLPALVATPSGPAVSWSDNSSGYSEIYVRQWNGSAWTALGSSASGGGVSNEQGTATNYSLAVDHHGRLLALWAASASQACADPLNESVPVHFRRFEGSGWNPVANSTSYTNCNDPINASWYGTGASGTGTWVQIAADANDVPVVTNIDFNSVFVCAFY